MDTLRRNKSFFLGYLIFFTIGVGLCVAYNQAQILEFINSRNSPTADFFFKYYTHVGDGIFLIAVAVILMFLSIKKGVVILLAGMVEGGLVQLLKQYIFTSHTRPWMTIKSVHLVEDFSPYINNSFPSGHSATAFCTFLLLSLFVAEKRLGFLFFILAILVAYSRIYLAQHYFIDTLIGSLIGVLTAIGFYYFAFISKNKLGAVLGRWG
ncbi:MAG: phosphatase PAP2 family protein [Bacteroidetes bacterium]|nr:phosphatase PAP2 family protein [Bacteroidota bacterium]